MVKSKKRLICLVVVLVILATSLVGLVGCKSKNENIIEIELICVSDTEVAIELTLNSHLKDVVFYFYQPPWPLHRTENTTGLFTLEGENLKSESDYDIITDFYYPTNDGENYNISNCYKGDKVRFLIKTEKEYNVSLKGMKYIFFVQTNAQLEELKIISETKFNNIFDEQEVLEYYEIFKGLSQRYEIIIPNKDI